MILPVFSAVGLSFLLSKLCVGYSLGLKKSFGVKERGLFYEKKSELLDQIDSIITLSLASFSAESAEKAKKELEDFERKLSTVCQLEASDVELNGALSKLSYLDLAINEKSKKKSSNMMGRHHIDGKHPSEKLYRSLYKAKSSSLKKALTYLREPLKIIASPIAGPILRNKAVRLPRSTYVFFRNALRGKEAFLGSKLGEGRFSEVFFSKLQGRCFACKKNKEFSTSSEEDRIKGTCSLMLLKHPNILEVEAVSDEVYLQLAEGDLIHWHNRNKKVSLKELIKQFTEIASALRHIHEEKFIHKDIKPDNILFLRTKEGTKILLCDLGFIASEGADSAACGSLEYVAPEIWANQPYTQKIDIFAFGVLMYYLTICEFPFIKGNFEDNYEYNQNLMKEHLNKPFLFQRSIIKDGINLELLKIIESCLHGDPLKRPSMEQILESFKTIAC